jgi:hypothetical protein
MNIPKDFIEVTSIYDGKKSVIRSESIEAVHDNDAENVDFGVKPAHRTIVYNGRALDVIESLEDICNMIYKAEF